MKSLIENRDFHVFFLVFESYIFSFYKFEISGPPKFIYFSSFIII